MSQAYRERLPARQRFEAWKARWKILNHTMHRTCSMFMWCREPGHRVEQATMAIDVDSGPGSL